MHNRLITLAASIIFLSVGNSICAGNIETLKKEIRLRDEEAVEINMEMGLANLEITTGKSNFILIAQVEYNPEKIKPTIDYQEGTIGILEIESKKRHRVKTDDFKKGENDWRLAFTDEIPLDIKLELGLGEGKIDLTNLRISNMNIDAGLSEIEVYFDKPNREELDRFSIDSGLGELTVKGLLNANIDEFKFSGGLGASTLYFTGNAIRPMEAKIEVGLGSVEIIIDEGTPVKIYHEKSFLSSVDLTDFRKIDKNVYVSRQWNEDAPNRLILDIEVGLGSVEVDWK